MFELINVRGQWPRVGERGRPICPRAPSKPKGVPHSNWVLWGFQTHNKGANYPPAYCRPGMVIWSDEQCQGATWIKRKCENNQLQYQYRCYCFRAWRQECCCDTLTAVAVLWYARLCIYRDKVGKVKADDKENKLYHYPISRSWACFILHILYTRERNVFLLLQQKQVILNGEYHDGAKNI